MVKVIPEGFHSVTPNFTFKDSKQAIEFYKKAFNATLLDLFPTMDGKGVMHASIKIGDSILMMADEMNSSETCPKSAQTLGNSPIGLFLYVTNVEDAFKQAVSAGGKVTMPVTDMFWGDRVGQISDPFGYSWMIATHTEDLSKEDMKKRAQDFFASMSKN